MASVELIGIQKRFGDVRVVHDLSLSIADGEFVVLVGRSGCGKSTTLRMIAGLEDPTAGEIRIGGRRVNELEPKDRDVGMVFQSYALYPHMTVRENLAFALALRKAPADEIRTRVAEVARTLAIDDLLGRRPAALSGGQRQRVAMGRALVRRPKAFLFDEPLSNLDASLRVQMRAEIAQLHRRVGTTSVYVTHDQVEAMTLATRLAILDSGALQQVGAPDELYTRPVNRFVATFLGAPAMNVLDGRVESVGGRTFFRAAGAQVSLAPSGPVADLVALGLRPHDLRLLAPEPEVPGALRGVVGAVERLGWERYVHVDYGSGAEQGRVVVRADERAADVQLGEPVAVDVPGARAHGFARDGRTLFSPASSSTGRRA